MERGTRVGWVTTCGKRARQETDMASEGSSHDRDHAEQVAFTSSSSLSFHELPPVS